MGYGSVNRPVDRDPVCGYNGIIEDVCPQCGRSEEEHGVPFERIRRITRLSGGHARPLQRRQARRREQPCQAFRSVGLAAAGIYPAT